MTTRPIQSTDLAFVREELVRHWGDVNIWSVGRRYQADELPGFVAIDESSNNQRVGLVTYCIQDGGYQAEIVTLSSRIENRGAGEALLDAAVDAIRAAGCVRVYLCATLADRGVREEDRVKAPALDAVDVAALREAVPRSVRRMRPPRTGAAAALVRAGGGPLDGRGTARSCWR